ncbi:hypothetical protein C4D60_Mb01t19570 [Musa balbisiana]|uniref:ATP-dependent DNA helicase 2 subunit KU80 n=1 Tax=Musa balbisiana TaxID=52838 RepID=A0A4S8JQE6_MUSBA|nr:hypothetical protein C4D60_Mb01t19570 [Musa balbisiana]
MARNKESLVLLIDVGPSIHSVLQDVEGVCSMLVQKKLIFSKSDEVGIVLFGTEDTNNELEKEVGGYEHVVVLRDIRVVDDDAVVVLKNLPRGTFPVLDAIVVGMDMLIKKFGVSDKGKKRLYLITDARFSTKEPYEGTKEDQVDTISQQMKVLGIRLNCLIIREKICSTEHLGAIDENDKLLDQFSRKAMAKTVHVDCATSLLGAIKTRNVVPVTVFRGDLELSSMMKIKVWVYKKTSEEKFPTLKKYSDKAPASDKFATHEVKVDFEYKSSQDPDIVVPPEQRIKGYRYGPQVVPISSAEWEAVKFKPEKGVKLLGFTDASNILRRPQPDSFYFNILPFAEDVREFQFPSFSSFPSSWQPDQQQQEAADDLVRMLDLAPFDRKEVLQPDYTPNPVLERFYQFLHLKSKAPEIDVPQLDRSLKRIAEPDPDFLSRHNSIINNFQERFELKENPKKKKLSRRAWREKPSASNDEKVGVDGVVPKVQSSSLKKSLSSLEVEKIGDLNPVQDFEAMMARRDSSKWITEAIKDMQHYIYHLLENSYEGNSFPKAIECLMALRKGCILEQEPKEFNRFMLDICKKFRRSDLADFLELLYLKKITLISKSEAADSDLTEEEAKNLPIKMEDSSE